MIVFNVVWTNFNIFLYHVNQLTFLCFFAFFYALLDTLAHYHHLPVSEIVGHHW